MANLRSLLLFFLISSCFCFLLGKSSSSWLNNQDNEEVVMVQREPSSSGKRCDLSVGKWVYDESYPLYDSNCPYLSTADFETSIEFCWAPLLVELKKGPENKRVLHLDLIEENARYWRGVDVLVFDSAHWWTHSDQWSS
ncbi:hypothetical protein COLO4_24551 [Corchorus olitorius]|uniref:Trichome birefringence-like C-terminal domain-containing protein n=1 Tax=Corchorus olitorius TaxID=93759 RepID=A0A1R3I943_9ROSI|nr:hypothetical protein COLO4_24551 [Corchorus olitorius]